MHITHPKDLLMEYIVLVAPPHHQLSSAVISALRAVARVHQYVQLLYPTPSCPAADLPSWQVQ